NGFYRLVVPAGTYTVRETQPGFYTDGLDIANGQKSTANDQYSGVQVGPPNASAVTGYNFGEGTIRPEFVPFFLNRRALFCSAIVSGATFGPATTPTGLNISAGDVWVSFDGGFDGLRTITATSSDSGTVTMRLYSSDNLTTPIANSIAVTGGATLTYTGVT